MRVFAARPRTTAALLALAAAGLAGCLRPLPPPDLRPALNLGTVSPWNAARFPDGVYEFAGMVERAAPGGEVQGLVSTGRLLVWGNSSRVRPRFSPDCEGGRRQADGSLRHRCGDLDLHFITDPTPGGWVVEHSPAEHRLLNCTGHGPAESPGAACVAVRLPSWHLGPLRLRRIHPL